MLDAMSISQLLAQGTVGSLPSSVGAHSAPAPDVHVGWCRLAGGVLRPGPPAVLKVVLRAGHWAMQQLRGLRVAFVHWLRDG